MEDYAAPAQLSLRARARDGDTQRRNVGALTAGWRLLEDTERMMAAGMSPHVVTRTLMERGLSRTRANTYQAAVRKRWATDEQREGREQRLLRYRHIAEQAIADAAQRKVTVCIGKDDDGERIFEVVEQPDSKAIATLLAVLVKMEGEPEPPASGLRGLPSDTGAQAVGTTVVEVTGDALSNELRARRRSAA